MPLCRSLQHPFFSLPILTSSLSPSHSSLTPAAPRTANAAHSKAPATRARAQAAHKEPFSFKVLTVNIHKGFTFFNRKFILAELREAVRQVGADVVFLQEVSGSNAKHLEKLDNYPESPHYEYLADSIWPQYAYGRNAVYTNGDHGNAMLSKFPIVRYENHDISISGPERRGMLHCELEIPGQSRSIHAICVHLGLIETHRTQQIKMLCNLVRKQIPAGAPVVVAGDFNDWRGRAHTQLARNARLREVFLSANGYAARTFPARLPMLQLDRIYVRSTVSNTPILLPPTPWSHLSDHAPLAAEIHI